MNSTVYIIMYHYVRELPQTRYPNIKGLLTSQFASQLDYLQAEGFNFVSAHAVTEAAAGGDPLPEKAVLLTFDDGYIDHYTNVFPILDNKNIPAFFSMPGKIIAEQKLLDVNRIHFLLAGCPIEKLIKEVFEKLDFYRGNEFVIPSNDELYNKLAVANRFDSADTIFVKRLLQVELEENLRNRVAKELFSSLISDDEKSFVTELYLSMDQVRLMARHGMEWGIHGYDHYWMNRLEPAELKKDIDSALTVFEDVLPKEGWMCCYPYGSISDYVEKCVRENGARGGFTTEVRRADLKADSIFRLPRFDTNDFPPKSENYKEISTNP